MREAFEAWFAGSRRSRGVAKRPDFALRDDGTYADDRTQRHWWTWQNAAAEAKERAAERLLELATEDGESRTPFLMRLAQAIRSME